MQDMEIWAVYKQDKATCSAYISACAGVGLLLGTLMEPFMPPFTAKLLHQLGLSSTPLLNDELIARAANPSTLIPPGHSIGEEEPKPLFRKITEAEVAELRGR
jgi:methionyl-tRNA synthetase